MFNNKKKSLLLLFFLLSSSFCFAETNSSKHPFYFGTIAGYGSTTWTGLVPFDMDNLAMKLSTPIKVEEGGSVWGFLTGYEFNSFFALEASYMNFPESDLYFDAMSLFSMDHDMQQFLSTKTETVSLMAKLMIPVAQSKVRVFSSVGAAGVHRRDILIHDWHAGPTFSAGINYNFVEHIMGEIAANFTAGYGESEINPINSYIPFLYSVAAHLIYRF